MDFDLGDVLSITTERLVSRDHIDGVYRILNYMTGDNLFTHQLSRAARECMPALLAQHPDLTAIVVPDFDNGEAYNGWLDSLIPQYGRTRDVQPLRAEDHTHISPFEELGLIGVPREKIITVVVPDDSPPS